MEELRSTEVLDREILEDARKKAHKILSAADDKVKSQTKRWQKKTEKSLASLDLVYKEREEKSKKEISARLPLDKRRLRSEITETLLKKNLSSFLLGLSRDRILTLLKDEFVKRLKVCAGDIKEINEKAQIKYSSMTNEEATKIINEVCSNSDFAQLRQFLPKEDEGVSALFPALILSCRDLKITASVEDAASVLLSEKRSELVKALLGEGALND